MSGITGNSGTGNAEMPYLSGVGPTSQLFGNNLSISDMIFILMMDRRLILEGQIKDQFDDMQVRNEWLQDVNKALQMLRVNRPTNDHDTAEYGKFIDHEGKEQDVHTWLLANGIMIESAGGDKYGVQAEFDAAISNTKAAVDATNSESQMEMTRLQGLWDKGDVVSNLISNMLERDKKSKDNVVSNMRG